VRITIKTPTKCPAMVAGPPTIADHNKSDRLSSLGKIMGCLWEARFYLREGLQSTFGICTFPHSEFFSLCAEITLERLAHFVLRTRHLSHLPPNDHMNQQIWGSGPLLCMACMSPFQQVYWFLLRLSLAN
jgi:hypothetical protein